MLHRRLAPPAAVLALLAPLAVTSAPVATATSPAVATRPSSTPSPTVRSLGVPSLPAAQRRAVTVAPEDASSSTGAQRMTQQAVATARSTKDFGLVGVTWAKGTGTEPVRVQVRTRTGDTWSGWTDLDVDTNTDGTGTRAGTEPLWAGESDGIAARVLGPSASAPKDVKVVLVDPGATSGSSSSGSDSSGSSGSDSSGATPSDATSSSAGGITNAVATAPRTVAAAAAAPSYTPQPTGIVSRAGWGARAAKSCDSPVYGAYQSGVVFHHTAGSNSYTKAQSAGIVRSIQAFHMDGRGWCDIGYSFLIDKYGQMFEGRGGGVRQMVRGAHAGNYDVNTYAAGVSMMANLDTAQPTAAMKSAAVRLIGWRIGAFYVPATGTYGVANGRLNRISGHREVYASGIRPATSTACPGKYGYAWLTAKGGLRDAVASYVSGYSTPNRVKAKQLGVAYTGNVYTAEYPDAGGYVTRMGKGVLYSQGSLGSRWVPNGAILTEYAGLGAQRGALGFPGGDVTTVGTRAYQRYKLGTVYRVSDDKAWGLVGPVDLRYRQLSSLAGPLGNPTSRVVTSGTTQSATFTGGTITYSSATGEYTVTYR